MRVAAAGSRPRAGLRVGGRFALLMALTLGVARPAVSCADDLVRVTTSFEAEHVALVLRRVAKVFSAGFGRPEADRVAADIDKLRPDEGQAWEFSAVFRHRTVTLQIRAAMDDMAMVDLDFATDPAAADRVRHEVDAFSNEHGL
jgi:hypothetical protein